MRRAGVAIVVGGLAVALAVGAAGGSGAKGRPAQRVLHLAEHQIADNFVDNPPHGRNRSPGDMGIFRDRLRNRAGREVGHDQGTCIVVAPDAQCSVTLFLRRGDIEIQGADVEAPRFEVAVVGGTGIYAGARGMATLRPGDPVSHLTVRMAR